MYQDILVRHYIWLRRESSTNGWRAVIWVILQRALPFFHNDNNYRLKNSCAVFCSSSFSLTLCRINVFLLFLTRYTSLVPLMRLISIRLHSFTAIFQIPHSICLTLIMFSLCTQNHRAKHINPYLFFWHETFFLLLSLHRNVCRCWGIRHFYSPQWFFQSAGWRSDDFAKRAESLTQKVLQGTRTGEGRHVVSEGGGK